ncbi:MAG: BrnT family toxin [Planctomycetota bacterium]|nr:BrnT family toxin [Planctomycetota bacterium]
MENQRKHGVSFHEAAALLRSQHDVLEVFDAAHSALEDRFIAIGLAARGVLVVVWTERDDDTIRIVTARRATQHEQWLYQRYLEQGHGR